VVVVVVLAFLKYTSTPCSQCEFLSPCYDPPPILTFFGAKLNSRMYGRGGGINEGSISINISNPPTCTLESYSNKTKSTLKISKEDGVPHTAGEEGYMMKVRVYSDERRFVHDTICINKIEGVRSLSRRFCCVVYTVSLYFNAH